jgi:hypothetical protein
MYRLLQRTLTCFVLAVTALAPLSSWGAVAVVSNRATGEIRFTVAVGGDKEHPARPKAYSLPVGDLVVINIPRGQKALLAAGGKAFELLPDTAYLFEPRANREIHLTQIGLSTAPPAGPEGVIAAKVAIEPEKPAALNLRKPTITVKIFVDEEEPTSESMWSQRLRTRVADASEILQKHCGMGLEVIGVGNWKSDNSNHDFDIAYAEFMREANPGKAQLALGFTSQYQTPQGRIHVGGTRGPLERHILLREWSKHFGEAEKLEILVHELGHHLGAVHSPERDSTMRPVPADRQVRAKQFIIHFDPLNTLAMNLVSEEVRERGVNHLAGLSLPTKLKLRAIYTDIAKALPDDPAAPRYLQLLGIPAEAVK